MSSARDPMRSYWGKQAKLGPPPFETDEAFDAWLRQKLGEPMGSGDKRSRMQMMLDRVVADVASPQTSAAVAERIVFKFMDRLGGKPEIRVRSSGGPTNLTVVAEQQQALFISDPGYAEKVIEADHYALRAIADRGEESGDARPHRLPGDVGAEAPPGDPEPADGAAGPEGD